MSLRFLYNNWWLKLLAIVLAAVAWVYVANKDFSVGAVPTTIPVVVQNLDKNLALSAPIPDVTVQVRTTKDIAALTTDDVSATVDLKGKKSGTFAVTIDVTTDLPNTSIVSVTPSTTTITLETRAEKSFPVSIETTGSVAENFAPEDPTSDPTIVTVSGPASVVSRVNRVVAALEYTGEKEEIKRSVSVQAQTEGGASLSAVAITPATVTVTVPLQRTNETKTVKVNVKTSGAPASGFSLASAIPAPAEVVLAGKTSDLEKISGIDTKPVDLNGLTGDTTRSAELVLPEGVTLDQPTEVTVLLKVSAKIVEKNLQLNVKFSNLGSGLSIVSYVPARVVVVVSGAANIVNNLNEDSLTLTVSLADKNQGEHTIPFNTNQVTAPQGVSVKSIETSSVVVTIGPAAP